MHVKRLSIPAKLLPVEDIGSFDLLQVKKFQSEHRSMILQPRKTKPTNTNPPRLKERVYNLAG